MKRRIIIQKIKMNKLIILFMLICFVFQTSTYVSAEDKYYSTYYDIGYGNNVYNFSELLSRYETNSITYKRNILDYQIQALSGTIADESYASVNNQYLDVLEMIEELKTSRDILVAYKEELQSNQNVTVTGSAISTDTNDSLISEIDTKIASIDSQLEQYNSSKYSLAINLSDANLSEDIADFYIDYQSLITKEAQNKLKNEFLKQCYSLIIYQEQLDYNKSYQVYLNMVNEANVIKYKYGLITSMTLDADSANALHNEVAIDENQSLYDTAILTLRNDTDIIDNSKIRLYFNNIKKQYNLETTVSQFINNNSNYYQIQNYIRSYQNYLSSASMNSNALYHQTELRIENYRLQKEELENSIRAYVKGAIKSYEIAFKSRDAAWKELQLKDNLYNTAKTKLVYKRSSRLEVQQALYEKEAAEVAYYKSNYEIVVWQDILDNYIYGASL